MPNVGHANFSINIPGSFLLHWNSNFCRRYEICNKNFICTLKVHFGSFTIIRGIHLILKWWIQICWLIFWPSTSALTTYHRKKMGKNFRQSCTQFFFQTILFGQSRNNWGQSLWQTDKETNLLPMILGGVFCFSSLDEIFYLPTHFACRGIWKM